MLGWVHWGVLGALAGVGTGQTALTYDNCPANFDPATYNSSLYSSYSSLAASIYGNAFSS